MTRSSLFIFVVFLSIFAVYFTHLPYTVQFLDTGELVASAYNLFVPHPPGYPLFIWLESLFIHLVPFGSVFWRASFLNMCFSIGALGMLWLTMARRGILGVGMVLALAFSAIFWRYSELPDVFSLNALFVALVIYLYSEQSTKKTCATVLPFVFALGLANHHTLIFLSPLVLDSLWQNRKDRGQYLAALSGAVAFVLLNGSLFLMNPESIHSWGSINSSRDLISHLLRQDYGTFKLVGNSQEVSLLDNLYLLTKRTVSVFLPSVFCLSFILVGRVRNTIRFNRFHRILAFCTILYVVIFFGLANSLNARHMAEVMDRFLIFFHVLLAFIVASILDVNIETAKARNILGIVLIICGLVSAAYWSDDNNFSKNTIIEDYAINLLNGAPEGKRALIVVQGDTQYFSLRYAQTVLGVRPDATLIYAQALFYPWYANKLEQQGVKFDSVSAHSTMELGLIEDVFKPNIQAFNIITPAVITEQAQFKLSILPLGRLISPGSGAEIYYDSTSPKMVLRSSYKDISSSKSEFDFFRYYWSDYAILPLIRGTELVRIGKLEEARKVFEDLLVNVPWCFPARERLCEIERLEQPGSYESCLALLKVLKEEYYPYF